MPQKSSNTRAEKGQNPVLKKRTNSPINASTREGEYIIDNI
jgi:hypothetical protein